MGKIKFSFYFKLVIASIPEITRPDLKLYFLASMNSRDVLKHCLDSFRHALSDAKDSRSLSSYVFKSFQKL